MTTTRPRRTEDHLVQQAVEAALEADPDVDPSDVGVAVFHGAVLLSGEVRSVQERAAAVHAAFRVAGVTTVEDGLLIHRGLRDPELSRADIMRGVQAAISWVGEAEDSVEAEIWRGTVTLTGHLRWRFQQRALRRAVESVSGVLRVDDRTRVILEA